MTMHSLHTLGFLGPIGWPELVVLGLLGVVIFGKRLPEVGKSIGRGIVEFKRGLAGIDDDVENASKGKIEGSTSEQAKVQPNADAQAVDSKPPESERAPQT